MVVFALFINVYTGNLQIKHCACLEYVLILLITIYKTEKKKNSLKKLIRVEIGLFKKDATK